jgi:hypothetical protein
MSLEERLNIIEKKLDTILDTIDSEFIIMEDLKTNEKGFSKKDLFLTVLPYIISYAPYLFIYLKFR